jgi:predicted NAD-dependent protein-ADP-ribosyltransferase YbiA (DUF1768 family)
MVKSKLNKDINYHEYSHLEEEDFKYNTPLFNLKILGITVIIGVGQLNYDFSKRHSVVYVPIYLFNAETEFMKQIGIFEMPSNNVKMDESGDLDIHKLTPLLYGFVNTELLRKSLVKAGASAAATTAKTKVETAEIKKSLAPADAAGHDDNDDNDDNDETDDDNNDSGHGRYDITGLDARQKHLLSGASILPLQTKEQSELERKQYKHNPTDLWIQMYLRNKYFNFIDNEGGSGSDSFFAVIRDALLTQGRTATILELRKQLSEEVTDDVFRAYREKFVLYHGLARTQTRETKELVNQYNDLKRRISTIHDRAQQQLMIGGAKKLVIEHNMKLDEVKYTKLLADQYGYMKEVRSTQQLKERMMTSLYWPDAWGVATMERVLNMKFVFFSSNAYETGDIDNVLQCGGPDTIDAAILKRGRFEPTAYILIDKGIVMTMAGAGRGAGVRTMAMDGAGGGHGRSPRSRSRSPRASSAGSTGTGTGTGTGGFISKTTNQNTYKLITYKTHGILTFSELPYDIKLLITTKCLETQAGAFCLIPQFKLFQKELGIRADELQNTSLDDLLEEVHTDAGSIGNRAGSHLYTPDIVFQFYAKSNPNALPGAGPGEKIPEHDKIHFQKLATFDNWRRKLSNFWSEPFMLDSHTWQSVEHYYQGSKFKNNNREFYLKFSLDSRSELSSDPVIAKAAGSKSGKLRPSRISVDPDFFNHGRSEREMENAIYAKFSQNKGLKDLLLATRNAKLVQYIRGGHPVVFHHLMRVRHKLRTNAR